MARLESVTRIVAGSAGGRRLQVPRSGTRPTSERVREALFSSLQHAGLLEDAVVLDLYAGSGALGLEAASRGAAHVTLVEVSRPAAELCRRNAAALGLTGQVSVAGAKVQTFLRGGPRTEHAAHLVLLDPPYDIAEDALAEVLQLLTIDGGAAAWLTEDAVVVVERSRRSPEPSWPEGLARTDRRAYGDTVMWFAAPTVHKQQEAPEPA
ncbi:16S rRNA (guanine(966)-N(2))-methyltransferase RsmD [Georgenia sp. 10Sc9-8]|uniref:16S rRNA (Guanine(966)-N(2))-methyltransferase RsmD n=1 Tax=Georgenia halotolerans TaxID=3028317 RepID=A0ABT5TT58_9MICO|nr:16S rRNA (guanine(966)-N(2))-methyltransferase RsmD [Georgenia halotolerans]